MSAPLEAREIAPEGVVLGRLESVSRQRGELDLASHLSSLRSWLGDDLTDVDQALGAMHFPETPMHQSAGHLLQIAGKRLRPMCVLLAARLGGQPREERRSAVHLAVAAELIHAATLLHDDVVDLGDQRRGAPTARTLYGNAASIFAGDWLLVDALCRVRRAGMTDVLDRALSMLTEMLEAESLQLLRRGKLEDDEKSYFAIIEGKTASLFGWAMFAGSRAGGLPLEQCEALARFGRRLGVAFQLVDDILDFNGAAAVVGKSLYTDLGEGKLTYPLLMAVRAQPELADEIESALGGGAATLPKAVIDKVLDAMERSEACAKAQALVDKMTADAVMELDALDDSRGKQALAAVAYTMAARTK